MGINRLNAYDLARMVSSERCFRFGIEEAKAAADKLHILAARLECGDLILQEAVCVTTAERDDYAMTYFTVMFAEPDKAKPKHNAKEE
jgi:hypothetical protein